ncbi:TetR family transcriptional regulator [Microbacterium terricola]|uniref:TetR family transcriptional regulator n=1 Tax=Microbacterium terricola TaxID=344163 RepID=A0ABM8DZ84_9MICO|nr:TetR family transcriptional regulator [Microbacterium terricola]UYK41360.1 TetR family transcriptional regulator [Microbacterium terricola]BDV30856.1 hypothetical protein Microterr_15160 [Microbacterium terricola]
MTVGRPKASSRETLAEAACELFLEQGYEATSVGDITRRAGVSRSSFFNYFSSKADVLWGSFDERLDAVAADLTGSDAPVAEVLRALTIGFAPDSLALAIANADIMGLDAELERERAVRQRRLERAVSARLARDSTDSTDSTDGAVGAAGLASDVAAAAYAGALLAAVWRWAESGAGRTDLADLVRTALALVPHPGGAVRQLRLVVQADDFDGALAFYRDVVGMPQSEAYEADGGARVAILDAGRATLEIANPAQVAFIDGVETDGDAPSERLRLGLEVPDTAAAVERLAAAGATVEASVRETPWRSLNARLRGPADLQLTIFQELDQE